MLFQKVCTTKGVVKSNKFPYILACSSRARDVMSCVAKQNANCVFPEKASGADEKQISVLL